MAVEQSLSTVSGGTVGQAQSASSKENKSTTPAPYSTTSAGSAGTRVYVPGTGNVLLSPKADVAKFISGASSSPTFVTPQNVTDIQKMISEYEKNPASFSPTAKASVEQYKAQGFVSTEAAPYAQLASMTPPLSKPKPEITKQPDKPTVSGFVPGMLTTTPTFGEQYQAGGAGKTWNPYTQKWISTMPATIQPATIQNPMFKEKIGGTPGAFITGSTLAKTTGAFDLSKELTSVQNQLSALTGPQPAVAPLGGTTITTAFPSATLEKVVPKQPIMSPDIKSIVMPKSVAEIKTRPIGLPGAKPGKEKAQEFLEIPAITATGKETLAFVAVPSKTEFISESEKKYPYSQRLGEYEAELRSSYKIQATAIRSAGAEPSQTEEVWVKEELGKFTPAEYEKLIGAGYETAVSKYATENIPIGKAPVISSSELQKLLKFESIKEFQKEKILSGEISAPTGDYLRDVEGRVTQMTTLLYPSITIPSLLSGAQRALGDIKGAEQSREFALEQQATLYAKAAFAGQEPFPSLKTLTFAAEQVPQTFTGELGLGLAGGQLAGATLKAVAPRIATAVGGSEAATAAGAKYTAFAVSHPYFLKYGVGYGVPIAFEGYQIGTRAGLNPLAPREPATLAEQASETTKETFGLLGFGKGFKEGLQYGTGFKYETSGYPITKPFMEKDALGTARQISEGARLEVAKTIGYEWKGQGVFGGPRADIFASKVLYPSPTGWGFGGPKFSQGPDIKMAFGGAGLPKGIGVESYQIPSATEAQVLQKFFSAPSDIMGGTIASVRLAGVEKALNVGVGKKAPIKPKSYEYEAPPPEELTQITPEKAERLRWVVEKHKGEYVEQYGYAAARPQTYLLTRRPTVDVDIQTKFDIPQTEALTKQMYKELTAPAGKGIPGAPFEMAPKGVKTGFAGKQAVLQINPERQSLMTYGGRNLLDIHAINEPEAAGAFFMGRYIGPELPAKLRPSGVPQPLLEKEYARKLTSVGTLQSREAVLAEAKGVLEKGQSLEDFLQSAYGTGKESAFFVGPTPHRAIKDISDVPRYGLSLGKVTNYPITLEGLSASGKVGKGMAEYISTFGKIAIPEGAGGATLIATTAPSAVFAGTLGTVTSPVGTLIGSGGTTLAGITPTTAGEYATTTKGEYATTTKVKGLEVSPKPMKVITSPVTEMYGSPGLGESPAPSISGTPSQIFRFRSGSTSFSISPEIASPSLSTSVSPYASPSLSASISPSKPPSPSFSMSASLSASLSPSLSPSLSASLSPSVSPSASVSPSLSQSFSIPPFSMPMPSSRGKKGGFQLARRRGKEKVGREKVTYGILSEGLSKELFGKATLGAGATTKGRAIFSPTAELEKAGVSFPSFLAGGGYVRGSGSELSFGKAGAGAKGIRGKGGIIKEKIKGLFSGDIRMNYRGSPKARKLL